MSLYRITIDRSLCSGFGACVEQSPSAFELDETGVAKALVCESDDPAVLDAVAVCPMGAIDVVAVEERAA